MIQWSAVSDKWLVSGGKYLPDGTYHLPLTTNRFCHSLFTTSAGFSFAARHTRQPMHNATTAAMPAKITR